MALALSTILTSSSAFVFFLFGKEVLDLNDRNFDTELAKYDHMLVVFYQPHSEADKAFSHTFSEAAKRLLNRSPPVYLAKVNDGVNPYVATHFNVTETPAMKWFENGKVNDYTGYKSNSSGFSVRITSSIGSSFNGQFIKVNKLNLTPS